MDVTAQVSCSLNFSACPDPLGQGEVAGQAKPGIE